MIVGGRWGEVGGRVEYRDVDVFLTDMLDINLALLIEHLLLHHSEGDVAPEIVETAEISVGD